MKNSAIYLRFIHLLKVIEASQVLPALEPIEHQILQIIALANLRRERLSVKDLMGMPEIASPATVHKNIKSMREKGWIYLEDTEDARRKQLRLTPQALTHFDKLGIAVKKAIK